jgi:alpha-glucosidase
LQDPIWHRTRNAKKGRDGCRVPLPWTDEGNSYGFGSGPSWLPQPTGFSGTAVSAQFGRPESTLELYREALRVRRQLQTAEELEWVPNANPDVLHFARPGGWHCVTNFGTAPIRLPEGVVRVSSVSLADGLLPGECTAWLTEWPRG